MCYTINCTHNQERSEHSTAHSTTHTPHTRPQNGEVCLVCVDVFCASVVRTRSRVARALVWASVCWGIAPAHHGYFIYAVRRPNHAYRKRGAVFVRQGSDSPPECRVSRRISLTFVTMRPRPLVRCCRRRRRRRWLGLDDDDGGIG